MALDDLPDNIRLLCSYGKSTSDICRRLKINRQQFSKYLNGQTRPSLPILRRICDFFGVDEAEILMSYSEFSNLVRLRPPHLSHLYDPFAHRMGKVIRRESQKTEVLERHEGYYYVYFQPDSSRNLILRSVAHIFAHGKDWFSKELERYDKQEFAVPSPLKYSGIVFEANNHIVTTTREQGIGMSMSSTILVTSDYDPPIFLPDLV
ncbi:MAG: helix-turn-helix domain-containing protein [Gammaproteobacteria bacterium]|nr:helix-turn-helix domain-containing protein [Gammaproteobacteria bacterium]